MTAGSGGVPAGTVATVRRLVAEQLPEVRKVFRGMEVAPFRVEVHAARETMPADLVAHLDEGAAGFALLGRHEIHLVWAEMRQSGSPPGGVVAHEIAHELLDQFVAPNGRAIPRWFHEGLAQWIAGDTYLGAREQDLLWRFGTKRRLSFGDLRERFPSEQEDLQAAYAQSYSYVAWLAARFGVDALLDVAKSVDRETTFSGALVGRTGRSTLQLEDAWRHHLVYESGAPWRVMLEHWFGITMILCIPALLVAVRRRFARERRAAEKLARGELAPPWPEFAVEPSDLQGPPLPPDFPGAEPARKIARDGGAGW